MFHPTRGGTRGGKDQFNWDDVKSDKDRECYLGHSVMAPVGRWQQGKDITWYASDSSKQKAINVEFKKAKDLEEKALMAALGYKVIDKPNVSDEEEQPVCEPEPAPTKTKEKKSKKAKKEVQGPQSFDSNNKKELDEMLLNLVVKNGLDKVLQALGYDKASELKKHKKHKKHKSSSKRKTQSSSSSSSDSSDSEGNAAKNIKRKKSSNEKKKSQKKSKRSSSTESGSSSESD